MKHIQTFIDRGYEFVVKPNRYYQRDERKYHALVWLGTTESSHNFLGETVKEAVEGLDKYLELLPAPTAPGDAK